MGKTQKSGLEKIHRKTQIVRLSRGYRLTDNRKHYISCYNFFLQLSVQLALQRIIFFSSQLGWFAPLWQEFSRKDKQVINYLHSYKTSMSKTHFQWQILVKIQSHMKLSWCLSNLEVRAQVTLLHCSTTGGWCRQLASISRAVFQYGGVGKQRAHASSHTSNSTAINFSASFSATPTGKSGNVGWLCLLIITTNNYVNTWRRI